MAMKTKIILFSLVVSTCIISNKLNAQELKAEAGNKSIEVSSAPFIDDKINPDSKGSIRLRYFLSSSFAVRVGLSMSGSSESDIRLGTINTLNDAELKDENSSFGFSIN